MQKYTQPKFNITKILSEQFNRAELANKIKNNKDLNEFFENVLVLDFKKRFDFNDIFTCKLISTSMPP
jgi:hypothetical protein